MYNEQIHTRSDMASTSVFEIDTIGASIRRLKLSGVEILWSGVRPDEGRGITHPCIPNFNIADGLPNHGPARKDEWKQVNDSTFSWKMQAVGDVYPAGLEATRTFSVEQDVFTVTTKIINHSAQDLPINIAEHNYFACPADERAKVKVNGVLFDKGGLEANAKFLPIGGHELQIEIPNLPAIVMKVDGYGAFAQWSQPNAPFVCVEPIQVMPHEPSRFMSDAPRIKVNEEKIFKYQLELK
jgi:galactose mutarotase-like enzyme